MKNMTLSQIAGACGAELVGVPQDTTKEVLGAVIDSRLIEQDYLFFAIKGERVDGHDYIAKAFESGAMAVVCEHVPDGVQGPCLVVKDTLKALREIAEFYRKQLTIKIVGISGSVGKTSTKEFIAGVLSEKYNVLKTEMNFNNEIGVPLTVLKIRDEHEVAVLEMGISDFGEMSRLAAITRPDICVITNIGQSHLEKLIDRDGIIKAKTEMFDFMQPDGDVVLCGDDDKLADITEVKGKKPHFYGTKDNAGIKAIDITNRGLGGSICTVRTTNGEFSAEVNIPGKHMVLNALAATAVGTLCGLTTDEIARGITGVKAVTGRSCIRKANTLTIIDDCYNANPASMKAAVDLLNEAFSRKVAILGDMFELGENEAALHAEVGEYAGAKTDVLVCIGTLSKNMFDAALTYCKRKGKSTDNVYYFETKEAFIDRKGSIIQNGDAVLVKASHGMQFPVILDALIQGQPKKEETRPETEAQPTTETTTASEVKPETEVIGESQVNQTTKMTATSQTEAPVRKSNTVTGEDDDSPAVVEVKVVKNTKRRIIFALVIVVLVFILAGVGFLMIRDAQQAKKLEQGILVYCVDTSLYAVPDKKPVLITDTFAEDSDHYIYMMHILQKSVALSDDGKYMFYGKNVSYEEAAEGLFYNKMSGKTKNEELVDTQVDKFFACKDSNVIYQKESDIYFYTRKDETVKRICSDAELLDVDSTNSTALVDTKGTVAVYEPTVSDSMRVIDTGVTKVYEYAEDFSTVLYAKNRALYIYDDSGIQLLTNNGMPFYVANPDKKYIVYFFDGDVEITHLSDFVKDDLKRDKKTEAFLDMLEKTEYDDGSNAIKSFQKGSKEPKTLSEQCVEWYPLTEDGADCFIYEYKVKKADIPSAKKLFKDGADGYEVMRQVEDSLSKSYTNAIIHDGKHIESKESEGVVTRNGVYEIPGEGFVYTINDPNGAGYILKKVDYRWFAKGKSTVIAQNVWQFYGVYKKQALYISDKSGKRELYWGDKVICSDYAQVYPTISRDGNTVFFLNKDNTLVSFDGTKFTNIAEKVASYVAIDANDVWYYRREDASKSVGELYHFDGRIKTSETPVQSEVSFYTYYSKDMELPSFLIN